LFFFFLIATEKLPGRGLCKEGEVNCLKRNIYLNKVKKKICWNKNRV